jgi:hypothetical protein
MDQHEIAYGILLNYLPSVDLASLRLCCRAWKCLVDRSLSCLQPYRLVPAAENNSYHHVSCLSYTLRLSSASVHLISPQAAGSQICRTIAQQFPCLRCLEIDCSAKSPLDFGNLRLLHLASCTLLDFPFNDLAALSHGVGRCFGLTSLRLQSDKVIAFAGFCFARYCSIFIDRWNEAAPMYWDDVLPARQS